MITREQFLILLKTQVETNAAYGVQWNENSIRCAIYREWGEFLDEVESHWHCYKKDPAFNRTDAVYELVDIAHFMLCQMLNEKDADKLAADPNFPRGAVRINTMRSVEITFTEFMYKPEPWNFAFFLERACALLDITTDVYMQAHMAKNARNRIRAAAGVTEGKYDKSAEAPLTLEF